MKAPIVIAVMGLAGLLPPQLGCGASIQAVYEGDVRFEHCMALDARPQVRTSIRRACWEEWVDFYTYGQTRDRVAHAQLRIRELSDESAFVTGDASQVVGAGDRGPDPASSDPAYPGPGATDPPASSRETAVDACAGSCRSTHDACTSDCEDRGCRAGCSSGLRSCMRECS